MKTEPKKLKIITYKDVMLECEISPDTARKLIATMRKYFGKKRLVYEHLERYLTA